MSNKISEYFMGKIKFKAEGGLLEKLLNLCSLNCIVIHNISYEADGFTATVPQRFFSKIIPLAKITHSKIIVLNKKGLYFKLLPIKTRYGIVVGMAMAILTILLLSNVIWSIRFFGFTKEESEKMRAYLYENNIYEGSIVYKNKLNTAENNILLSSPDYGWISLNFIKGRLEVEKTDAVPKVASTQGVAQNIIAKCDGIIRHIDLSEGFLKVCEGQSVAKGDVLVSGTRTDVSGALITTNVNAKMFAEVEKTYEYMQTLSYSAMLPTSEKQSYYALQTLDKQIKLFKQKPIIPHSEERLLRYPLNIFGFALPCTIFEYEIRGQRETQISLSQEQAIAIAKVKINDAIKKDLTQANILTTSEEISFVENKLFYKLKIRAEANIAEIAQSNE
ncbi:MAG: sporulation protein YqfD [Oscillospiraceae bacterium]